MGKECTRNCKYCAVSHHSPAPLDPDEPQKIAEAVKELNLSYAVITSVTRDDLEEGGASHFAKTVYAIRELSPDCKIELLVPDFKDSQKISFNIIKESNPDVFNHNIEVVPSLFPSVRPQGDYQTSLALLKRAANANCVVKSGLMIGLGETESEIEETLSDLYQHGVRLLTVGQYLRSSKDNLKVSRYYNEEYFNQLKELALEIGFTQANCGPMVRSSYHAAELEKSTLPSC
jgi:lipoic acid synthetase